MATTMHRAPGVDGASDARLEQLLSQQDALLLNGREFLRESLPTATSGVMDFEELFLDAEEQGVGFSMLALTARTAQGIETTLRRLEAGELGRCSECRCRISGARLLALPFAALCLTCQEERDTAAVWKKRVVSTRKGRIGQ